MSIFIDEVPKTQFLDPNEILGDGFNIVNGPAFLDHQQEVHAVGTRRMTVADELPTQNYH